MRFLSLRPPLPRPGWFYGAGAVTFGLAAVSLYAESQQAAERVLALHNGPPPAVAIERADPVASARPAGEVTMWGQVDVSLPLQIFFRDGPVQRRALAYPLLATTAKDQTAQPPILGYFYALTDLPQAEVLDMPRLLPDYEKVGAFGPIVQLNGTLGGSEALSVAIADLLIGQGRVVQRPLLAIAPFSEGRAAALAQVAPMAWPVGWLMMGVGFALGGRLLSQILPQWEERRRHAAIASQGRKRSSIAALPNTDKGRSRLAPLAPPAADAHEPPNGSLARLWRFLSDRRVRNLR